MEADTNNTVFQPSPDDTQKVAVDANELTAVSSIDSTASSSRSQVPISRSGRTQSSHSLLAANHNTDLRKSAHTQTTKAAIDRASVSMPPPLSKPNSDRRLSSSFTSIAPPRRSEDTGSDAVSPPSSVKSVPDDRTGISTIASPPSTATDTTSILTSSTPQLPGLPVLSPTAIAPDVPNFIDTVSAQAMQRSPSNQSRQEADGALPNRGPRMTTARSISAARRFSTSTPKPETDDKPKTIEKIGTIGVCALDVKARSRPSRTILNLLQDKGEFEVIIFGDKSILDEAVENWPICNFLISFFSDGFPLEKAISYVKLRKPFVVNDLTMQKVLWDRRLCLQILDQMGVPTPKRIEVNRDGGPRLESPELAEHVRKMNGVRLPGPDDGTGGGAAMTRKVAISEDGDTLIVDGKPFKKPFVEKPVSGEDHNVIIYFPKGQEGGGGRRLFRKIGNKSSDYDPNLVIPRCLTEDDSSYIYEQFLVTHNSEDVKAYTVGPNFCHAETRKSPVVDGVVRRNNHGKELRFVTPLSKEESAMATKVAMGFGQRICGFDMLRTEAGSFVIDVNGWSFVKDNNDYYARAAEILKSMFSAEKSKQELVLDDSSSEVGIEPPQRQNTSHGHRSALKTILKSPSMSRLSAHLPHPHRPGHQLTSGKNSPRISANTVPLSSPPTIENKISLESPKLSIDGEITMPPPILTTTNGLAASGPAPDAAPVEQIAPLPNSKHSWKLKGMVTVIRHADRTPKQKLKFTAHSQVFADLLKGHQEEVLLKGEAALAKVEKAVKLAMEHRLEDPEKLKVLQIALAKKGNQPGTKVQIKPMFRKRKPGEFEPNAPESPSQSLGADGTILEHEELRLSPTKERMNSVEIKRMGSRSDSISDVTFSRFSASENDLILDKLQLVMKWGGEPTHSARYQSQELGVNMRDDFKLLNRQVLDNVSIFTSSEKRVKTTAQIWAASFLGQEKIDEDEIIVRKDLLDDSNAAKDVMDKVKKKLKHLLREGNSAPEQFAWPKDMPEPSIVMSMVVDLMKFHRRVMRHNFKKLGGAAAALTAIGENKESPNSKDDKQVTALTIQQRWCTKEDPDLFKERWEKLFAEFCDSEKADPSKVSELYDTMKYDALHNKQFLEWVFTPSQSVIDEISREEAAVSQNGSPEPDGRKTDADKGKLEPDKSSESELSVGLNRHGSIATTSSTSERSSFAQKIGFRRRSVLAQPPTTPPLLSYEDGSYFKLFSGTGDSKARVDKKLVRLRELYRYAKILFDFVGPQEYGISDLEKLEIGLLTSLPLLREIVADLEELQAGEAKSFVYFTKESHIYTLLNCIMEGGIHTKIKRSAIPELDYLSQICFELYEAKDEETGSKTYSIRISISPGCHTVDPLDVSLDSKHAIGSAPRRSLTNHQDWLEVISTLKEKFHTVQLPKSFLAVNLSEKHAKESSDEERMGEDGMEMEARGRDRERDMGGDGDEVAGVNGVGATAAGEGNGEVTEAARSSAEVTNA